MLCSVINEDQINAYVSTGFVDLAPRLVFSSSIESLKSNVHNVAYVARGAGAAWSAIHTSQMNETRWRCVSRRQGRRRRHMCLDIANESNLYVRVS